MCFLTFYLLFIYDDICIGGFFFFNARMSLYCRNQLFLCLFFIFEGLMAVKNSHNVYYESVVYCRPSCTEQTVGVKIEGNW